MPVFPPSKYLLYRLAEKLFGINTAALAEPVVATFARGIVDINNQQLLTAAQLTALSAMANAATYTGSFPIPQGQDFVHVTNLGLAFNPTKCVCSVMKVTGGNNFFASCRLDSLSTDGFTADLSGSTDAGTYVLAFTVSA